MIEAPPSVIPHKHLCDITGLEVRAKSVKRDISVLDCYTIGTIYRSDDWIALPRQERL